MHILEHYGYGYIIMHQLLQGCLAVMSLFVGPFVKYIYVQSINQSIYFNLHHYTL